MSEREWVEQRSGIIIVVISHDPVGWVLFGCALIAHAIRDHG